MKAILINGIVNYQTNINDSETKKLFGSNIDGFKNADDATLSELGFKDIPVQTLLVNQHFGAWHETETEILRYVIDKTAEEIAIETKRLSDEKIAELEAAGVDVDYLENTLHFTREMATQLLGATQLCEKLGAKNVEWKNNAGKFIKIPLSKSYTICGSALQKFIAIHKEN
tara:strand:- start:525 stop:1037 length:513 start_codon:yes stop_codon:yes gene_type:complete